MYDLRILHSYCKKNQQILKIAGTIRKNSLCMSGHGEVTSSADGGAEFKWGGSRKVNLLERTNIRMSRLTGLFRHQASGLDIRLSKWPDEWFLLKTLRMIFFELCLIFYPIEPIFRPDFLVSGIIRYPIMYRNHFLNSLISSSRKFGYPVHFYWFLNDTIHSTSLVFFHRIFQIYVCFLKKDTHILNIFWISSYQFIKWKRSL